MPERVNMRRPEKGRLVRGERSRNRGCSNRRDLGEAPAHFRELLRVEPGALKPETRHGLGWDYFGLGSEFDEEISFASIEPVGTMFRIEHPMFLHSMLFVGGKLVGDIFVGRPR